MYWLTEKFPKSYLADTANLEAWGFKNLNCLIGLNSNNWFKIFNLNIDSSRINKNSNAPQFLNLKT